MNLDLELLQIDVDERLRNCVRLIILTSGVAARVRLFSESVHTVKEPGRSVLTAEIDASSNCRITQVRFTHILSPLFNLHRLGS